MTSFTPHCDVGLIGLAVMGQNFALNIASKGYPIAVYNRTSTRVDEILAKKHDLPVHGYKDLEEFVKAIKTPRKIILLVQAGRPVDLILDSLIPLLTAGDLVVDGGNEWYELTEARLKKMEALGFGYLGMGVSGGEEGARFGPALMPGGTQKAFELISPIICKAAAQVDGPCMSYIGPGGAGNYVKMVHNGIEYGDMELIAESYELLRRLGGMSNLQLSEIFAEWNKGELQSFLIEITSHILAQKDDKSIEPTRGYLVDLILDVAGSKGTGMWTVKEGAEKGVPIPTIAAALDMRYMSCLKKDRVAASKVYKNVDLPAQANTATLKDEVKDALYCSKICSYAQGMMLLQRVSDERSWNLNLGEIAHGWRGGCIIRAVFLDRITKAYSKQKDLPSLLQDEGFAAELQHRVANWRKVVSLAQLSGIAVPALSASLAYFDAYRTESLPVNLVQAQRDYFGAHTYKRIDQEGTFHTIWGKLEDAGGK